MTSLKIWKRHLVSKGKTEGGGLIYARLRDHDRNGIGDALCHDKKFDLRQAELRIQSLQ